MDSLNAKGIREKKLQESLRKLRFSIKMKKSKKPSSAQKNGDEATTAANKVDDATAVVKSSEPNEENKADQGSAQRKKEEQGDAEALEANKEELDKTVTDNDPDTGKRLAEAAQAEGDEG